MNLLKQFNGYSASMWLSSIMLLASAVYLIIWKDINDLVVIVIFTSVLVLISSFFIYIGMAKPMEDERIRKIGTTAATYSWYITLAFVGIFLFSGYYAHRVFNAAELFGLVIFLMVGSWMAINVYLNLKGDVD